MALGKKTGGRKKGSLNKKTETVISKLEELECDPIEGMAKIAKQAYNDGDLQLAGAMYKELAQYVAPKRKAVEHTGADGQDLNMIHKIERVIVDA